MYNRHLETFIAVADLGSFSKAAEVLYISSTAVIKQINLLEQELGLTLFERTHRGIELTKAGRSVYGDAKYLIQYLKDSITRAKNAMQGKEKTIRIGNSFMTPAQYIVELWPKIREHCPDIKFQIIPFENTPEISHEILTNFGKNIDIVCGWFDGNFWGIENCRGQKIEDDRLCCALPINHPLAFSDKLKLSDLYGETVMLIRRGWNIHTDAVRNELETNHPAIKIIDVPFFNIDVFNRCENGEEILIGFQRWSNIHPLLRMVPIEWEYTSPFGILHSDKPSPVVKEFLEAVSKLKQ